MASISDTQNRIRALQQQMTETERRIRQASQEITSRNQQALAGLSAQVRSNMSAWQQNLSQQYRGLLDAHTAQMQTGLQEHFAQMQQEYQKLRAQMLAELAEEQEKQKQTAQTVEELLAALEQEKEFLRETASRACTDAAEAIGSMTRSLPVEWFLPGHTQQYQAALHSALDYAEKGLYQTAVAIAESLQLRIRMDALDIDRSEKRWLHYFSVYIQSLFTEHTLLWETCRELPDLPQDFFQYFPLPDRRLSADQADALADGLLAPLRTLHNAEYGITERLRESGAADSSGLIVPEALLLYMQQHPEEAEQLDAVTLYSRAGSAADRLSRETQIIGQIRSRLLCAEQRIEISDRIASELAAYPYGFDGTPQFFDTEEGLGILGGCTVRLCDIGESVLAEVQIIPAQKSPSGEWFNCIGYRLTGTADLTGIAETLRTYFEDLTAETGIPFFISNAPENATAEQCCTLYRRQFRAALNGHA